MSSGFKFSDYKESAGKELKEHLLNTGETFDIQKVDEDMGDHGPMWVLHIIYGDGLAGRLFFSQTIDDKPDSRQDAIVALGAYLNEYPGVLVPARLKGRQLKNGNTYVWLEDAG